MALFSSACFTSAPNFVTKHAILIFIHFGMAVSKLKSLFGIGKDSLPPYTKKELILSLLVSFQKCSDLLNYFRYVFSN